MLQLDSGSALGYGCGPLVIKLANKKLNEASIIAVPGRYTTANMLFNLVFTSFKNKEEICFDKIENSIITGKFDAGVVIHENRFTYQNKGLVKVIDLGEFWHQKTNLPIPLGGIVPKRSLPKKLFLM